MAHPLERRRDERQGREKKLITQFRDDIKSVMELPAARRVVWSFIQAMGIDASTFNTNAMAQSHATGMQDAGRWWLNAIRDVCPEREAQMRAEANRQIDIDEDSQDDN